eukprot:8708714-Pyramimonas_sp.AAC.1
MGTLANGSPVVPGHVTHARCQASVPEAPPELRWERNKANLRPRLGHVGTPLGPPQPLVRNVRTPRRAAP